MKSDREKVIKGLETIRLNLRQMNHGLLADFCDDALALLKEQEAVKPKSKVRHGANAQIQHFCGNCNSMLHGKPKFCSECGRPVLWEGR